jgi:hypothetical protein
MTAFDPYHVWLGIPPEEQPANHYRLLGLRAFESNADVIDHAADRQMAHLRSFSAGERAGIAQKLLNEVSAARVCLLDAAKRAEYDARLNAALAPAQAPVTLPAMPPVSERAAWKPMPIPAPAAPAAPPRAPQSVRPPQPANTAPVAVSGTSALRRTRRSSPVVPIVVVGLLIVVGVIVLNAMQSASDDAEQETARPSVAAKPEERKPVVPTDTPKPPPVVPAIKPMPDEPTPVEASPVEQPPVETPAVPPMETPESPPDVPPAVEAPADDPHSEPPPVDLDAPFESLVEDDKPPGTGAADAPASNRLPVPEEAVRTAKEKEIRGLLAKEFAQTKPQEIWEFGRTLLALGNETKKDAAGRYVVFMLAIDRAAKAGDVETSLAAADKLTVEYEVDGLLVDALLRTVRNGVPVAAREIAIKHLAVFASAAFLDDRLADAKSLNKEREKLAAQTRNADQITAARNLSKWIAEAEKRWPEVETAKATLKTTPDDPVANRVLGEYLCLVKQLWPQGLPHLAKGDDETLKALALAELAVGDEQWGPLLDVADQWRKYAESASEPNSEAILHHALTQYGFAIGWTTGLSKKRAADGIREIQLKRGLWLDVLGFSIAHRDAASGEWTRLPGDGMKASRERDAAILNTFIEPNEDYEITSEFTWPEKVSDVFFFIPVGDRHCIIELFGNRNTTSWIDTVDGHGDSSRNPTRVKPTSISAGARCSMHATVRVQGATSQVVVKLNGRDYLGFRGDIARLSRRTDITEASDSRRLGIGVWETTIFFHTLKYRAIK